MHSPFATAQFACRGNAVRFVGGPLPVGLVYLAGCLGLACLVFGATCAPAVAFVPRAPARGPVPAHPLLIPICAYPRDAVPPAAGAAATVAAVVIFF